MRRTRKVYRFYLKDGKGYVYTYDVIARNEEEAKDSALTTFAMQYPEYRCVSMQFVCPESRYLGRANFMISITCELD